MKFLNSTKKTRFKLALGVIVFLGFLAMAGVKEDMEGLASTCVAGILSIGTGYIFGDSFRKSDKDDIQGGSE